MKKIVMMCFAVAIGFAAQGASIIWKASGVTASDGSGAASGYMAVLYVDQNQAAIKAALSDRSSDAFAAASTSYNFSTTVNSGSISATSGSYSAGDSMSGFLVVFDAASIDSAENFMIFDSQSKTVNAMGSNVSMSFGNATTKGVAWNSIAGGGGEDVPEPTSGLLLLVGGAMLALRRKQK